MDDVFKIEIWIYGRTASTYESNNIEEILKWFRKNWRDCYNFGGCNYEVYKNGEMLQFHEVNKIGFED